MRPKRPRCKNEASVVRFEFLSDPLPALAKAGVVEIRLIGQRAVFVHFGPKSGLVGFTEGG